MTRQFTATAIYTFPTFPIPIPHTSQYRDYTHKFKRRPAETHDTGKHYVTLRINKQQDASSAKILFCHEILHVSVIFCAHHQELSVVHLAIGMFHAGYMAAA